jgi:hypothetical protein
MPKSALGYRWVVSYRDGRGRPHQTMIDSTSQRAAIVTAQTAHPTGRDFTATKLSARPLK